MYSLLKEFLSILVLKHRQETLRQCCYDALAYAVEKAGQSNRIYKKEDAIVYLQKCLPGISDDDASMYIDSLSAKIVGVGAKPEEKV